MCLRSDGADGVRVPDDEVGVGAHGDPTLTGVQVQDLGRVGAGDRHEHVLVHLACSLEGKKMRLIACHSKNAPPGDDVITKNHWGDTCFCPAGRRAERLRSHYETQIGFFTAV